MAKRHALHEFVIASDDECFCKLVRAIAKAFNIRRVEAEERFDAVLATLVRALSRRPALIATLLKVRAPQVPATPAPRPQANGPAGVLQSRHGKKPPRRPRMS